MLRPSFASLRLHGPDQKGIVAACSYALDKLGCDIVKSEQWTDRLEQLFFQRIIFDYDIDKIYDNKLKTHAPVFHEEQKLAMEYELNELRRQFQLDSMNINWRTRKKNVAIFVSKYDHCLWEILLRHEAKELDCEIKVIISNHPKLKLIADTFNIPFKCFPINPGNKLDQERQEIELRKDDLNIDVIVLARYMQVLSNNFLEKFEHDQIINIHHSFLPAFIGGQPYHQAHERGVKLVGATAHYVTKELDEGPIIEQDVIHVSHRDDPSDLIRKGRIVERNVLVNALQAHLEDRIIQYNNRCIVFGE